MMDEATEAKSGESGDASGRRECAKAIQEPNEDRSLSDGPETKRRGTTAKNAITHGVLARCPVVGDESPEEWEFHLQGFMESYSPVGYVEECYVYEAAWATWMLSRLRRYEQDVVENQIETLDDPDLTHPLELDGSPGDAEVWVSSNPMEASEWISKLDDLDEDTRLPLGVGSAVLDAIKALMGESIISASREIAAGCLDLVDPHAGSTVGSLRRMFDVITAEGCPPREVFVGLCEGLLANEGLKKTLDEYEKEIKTTQMHREAIIPEERKQNNIARYRGFHERSRNRSLANLETSQRARAGTLPPVLRVVDLNKG